MNRFICKHWYWLYFQICGIRMIYYGLTNNRKKADKIITEHFDWSNEYYVNK